MNVVDSSGWMEYFANGPNADFFAPAIEDTDSLIVPVICLYEVFKHIFKQRGEQSALEAVAAMMQGRVIDLTATLALSAARLSVDLGLPMADSMILVMARSQNAVVWTQDSDFEGLDGVQYIRHKKG
ncbi:MAG: type II toxin-antitoxin system VapC family toxin [Anaerolineae bacterium]|nr:type II toxin-antitoxin system VapC family toxin [Anaerolineae bacterium]